MKLFCLSDVHSYFSAMKQALDAAGFNKDDPNHWLISCGDALDRGDESEEVLHYLMSLERKILIKGNHDILLEELCMREFPYGHDFSNGTVKTVNAIGGAGEGYCFDECCRNTWDITAAYRASLVNYFETENYIFVHSWLPITAFGYLEDWRSAPQASWDRAMWGNPFHLAQSGLNKTDKTIVFGHWHCSLGHVISSNGELSEFGENACWDIYRNNDWHVIGLDKCTAHTGQVNVLVIEDNFK